MQDRPIPVLRPPHGADIQSAQPGLCLVHRRRGQYSGQKLDLYLTHRRIGADTLKRGDKEAALAAGHGELRLVVADLKIRVAVRALTDVDLLEQPIGKAIVPLDQAGTGAHGFDQLPGLLVNLQRRTAKEDKAVVKLPGGVVP